MPEPLVVIDGGYAHRDDTAMGPHLSGRLGAKLREAASGSPLKQPADEARKPGSHSWPVTDTKRGQRVQDRRGEALTRR
ncbi:hypothetical protein B0I33_104285 [Prauserella shujinwangii]|uniref:Uncharacterized protein n=1 Tax=Prauserella shujinwangii TaxID=1453103 RepID=A0A2T0LWR4_9PSEU|nr:hypothetical protein [Prauserella shujinwangii]PRX48468.1 hypothetical protein B0I33_104285 [Prauserella shujinwangii]